MSQNSVAGPITQSHYQVRFDRGLDGVQAVGTVSDVVVWVDALPSSDTETTQTIGAHGAVATLSGTPVVLADLTNRSAAAGWLRDYQVKTGRRIGIAVIAAGNGVEDTLAAGAVIDALAELGIDFSSPEAAVVCAAFKGLERAVAHLLSASIAGRTLIEQGRLEQVASASEIDSNDAVIVVSNG